MEIPDINVYATILTGRGRSNIEALNIFVWLYRLGVDAAKVADAGRSSCGANGQNALTCD